MQSRTASGCEEKPEENPCGPSAWAFMYLPGFSGRDTSSEDGMKILDVKLDTVCGYTSTLPVLQYPEIAFAGRSNVGKSSMINVIMKRKRLARVGETPGKTRTINFYQVSAEVPDPEKIAEAKEKAASEAGGDDAASLQQGPKKKLRWKKDPARNGGKSASGKKQEAVQYPASAISKIPGIPKDFYLVDLPGYGFANVSAEEKAKWGHMIENYLNTSEGLKLVFLLVDIRHEPNANDIQMYDWVVESGFKPVIIATKADKVGKSQIARQTDQIRKTLGASEDTAVIPFSSLTREGAAEVYRMIGQVI